MNFRLFVGLEGSYNIRWGYKPTLCTINDSLNWNLRLEVESSVIVEMYAKEILAVQYLRIKRRSCYDLKDYASYQKNIYIFDDKFQLIYKIPLKNHSIQFHV